MRGPSSENDADECPAAPSGVVLGFARFVSRLPADIHADVRQNYFMHAPGAATLVHVTSTRTALSTSAGGAPDFGVA